MTNSNHLISVLARYTRPIVHMRTQYEAGRFGLVFGAGVSKDFNIPNWKDLVHSLATDPEVKGKALLKRASPSESLPYRTEMLFQHYKASKLASAKTGYDRRIEFEIAAQWVGIIRKHLYAKAPEPGNFKNALRKHPYLMQLLPLIRTTPLTVTYNFDTFIEQALVATRSTQAEEEGSRGYETVTNLWTQFRRKTAVIFHPNGVVPLQPMETPSDRFIFSESAFAAEMIGISAGHNAGFLSHLTRNTCLFVGASLEDETLRNSLAHNAKVNPGNYHYYIHFTEDKAALPEDHLEAIRRTNFQVYNLVTLFLDAVGIRALSELLIKKQDEFKVFADDHKISISFRFYLTGALGVGKSTAINAFRNLTVYDEWLEPRIPDLAIAWSTLSARQRRRVDAWIARQFKLKNDSLGFKHYGIFILDRGPLDPLAFTDPSKRAEKADSLLTSICPGNAKPVFPGSVIILTGDPEELSLRIALTERTTYTPRRLQEMENAINDLYPPSGSTRINTKGMSIAEVARRVAEIIHLDKYQEADLHGKLETIRDNP